MVYIRNIKMEYIRNISSGQLYIIKENCKVNENDTWVDAVVYSPVNCNKEDAVFCRTNEEVKNKFTRLTSVKLRHEKVSFDLIFDPLYPLEIATSRSIGIDVRATQDIVILPGEWVKVPTGISWVVKNVEDDYIAELEIRARSGLAARSGLGMVNGVGTIDEDYSGEIHALLINYGKQVIAIKAGDKVAQIIPSVHPNMRGADLFTKTKEVRGARGFGSSD